MDNTLFGAAVVTIATIAAACGPKTESAEERLADYVRTLEEVSGVDTAGGSYLSSLRSYPRRKDRMRSLEELRLGVFDYLALDDCGLQHLISTRNSGLGRVMPVSQRLIYEHRFVVESQACTAILERKGDGSRRLLDVLREVLARKSESLSGVYWNATFGSPEFQMLFSLATEPLSFQGSRGPYNDTNDSLRYFIALGERLGSPSLDIESADLEGRYAQLHSSRYGGRLLMAIALLTHHLDLSAEVMETRLDDSPLCPDGEPVLEARNLRLVFQRHYLGEVQPYLSRVHREASVFLGLIERLANQFEGQMPARFKPYFESYLCVTSRRGTWQRFEGSVARHIRAWQSFHDQCGWSVVE